MCFFTTPDGIKRRRLRVSLPRSVLFSLEWIVGRTATVLLTISARQNPIFNGGFLAGRRHRKAGEALDHGKMRPAQQRARV